VLRAATDRIMTEIAALLGELRGQTPPTEFYHPAVARRKLRQDLRALQEASKPGSASPATDDAAADATATDGTAIDSTAIDSTAADSTGLNATTNDGTAAGTAAP
jgi:hypothetical protein